jgi:hypothetical protein
MIEPFPKAVSSAFACHETEFVSAMAIFPSGMNEVHAERLLRWANCTCFVLTVLQRGAKADDLKRANR